MLISGSALGNGIGFPGPLKAPNGSIPAEEAPTPKKLINALTPLAVKNAKPGRHADGGGLQLLVKESGARSWVFRFMLKGKSRDIGLGPAAGAGAIPLAKARDLADAMRVKVKAGVAIPSPSGSAMLLRLWQRLKRQWWRG